MAIFLIKSSEVAHPDPVKDKGRYKIGDIVQVFEDGTPCVIPPEPPFWIIEVTGLSMADALQYMQSYTDTSGDFVRRKYMLDYNSLSTPIKNTLQRDRYYSVAWSKISSLVISKVG